MRPLTISLIAIIIVTLLQMTESKPKFGMAMKKIPFRKLKKILKIGSGASSMMMAAGLVDEIGLNAHGNKWSFQYFDDKFAMISTQMNLINQELQAMVTGIELHEFKISQNRNHIIIIACV